MKKDKDYIEEDRTEFNMMQLYLFRINKIQERMDEASGENDVIKFYLELRSLLSNCELKLEDENIEYIKVKEDIIVFGRELRGSQANEQTFNKNRFIYLERGLELATALRKLMNKAGMIYPKQVFKTIEQLAEESF